MTSCTLSEAKELLSELIDRALRGEPVVITQDGRPLVELKPASPPPRPPRPVTDQDIAWLEAHRVGKSIPAEDAATLVRKMRDEGW